MHFTIFEHAVCGPVIGVVGCRIHRISTKSSIDFVEYRFDVVIQTGNITIIRRIIDCRIERQRHCRIVHVVLMEKCGNHRCQRDLILFQGINRFLREHSRGQHSKWDECRLLTPTGKQQKPVKCNETSHLWRVVGLLEINGAVNTK